MIPVLSYLNNLQIGDKRYKSYNPKAKVNLDDQLLRLVNYSQDTLHTYHRYPDGPPFACKFRRDNELDLLALANENGEILIVDTEKSKVLRSFFAHRNAVVDICWLPDTNFLMTASADSTAKLYDMTSCECVSTYDGIKGSIKTIDVCHLDNNIFATGTKDGTICIWDRRERHSIIKRPCSVIQDAHIRYNPYRIKIDLFKLDLSSISSVKFQDKNHLVSAGVADGHLKVWDLRRTYLRNRRYTPWREMEYCADKTKGIGCSSLKFDSTHTKLYAYITSNEIHRFDCLSYSNDGVAYTGMISKSYCVGMDLSHDDQYILGGSRYGKAYIWNTNKPGGPILSLPCTKDVEVGAVAWCPYNITKLVTASDDCKLRIWRIQTSSDDDESYESKAEGCKEPNSTPLLESLKSLKAAFAKMPTPSPKTPVSKPITNYYSPVTPSTPVQPNTPSSSSSPETAAPSPNSDLAVRSPCKAVTGNEIASSVPSGHPVTSPQKGKENHSSAALDATFKSKIQVKRKLCMTKVTCKYHPEGCGRTKGGTRCGKRIAFYPPPKDQPSIKNFLTSP